MPAPAASPTPPTPRSMCRYGASQTQALDVPQHCVLVGVELLDDATDLPSFRHPVNAAYVLGPERSGLSPAMLAALPPRGADSDPLLAQYGGRRGAGAVRPAASARTIRRAPRRQSRCGCIPAGSCPSRSAALSSQHPGLGGRRDRAMTRPRLSRPISRRISPGMRLIAALLSLVLPCRPAYRRSRSLRSPQSRPRQVRGNSASSMTGSRRRIRSRAKPRAMRSSGQESVPALPGRGEVVLTVTERPSSRDTVAIVPASHSARTRR